MATYKWRTKIQAYLAKIAGYDVETPKGTTREQQLMKEISDNYTAIPAPEVSDEGKILGVSEGEWAAIENNALPAVTGSDNGKLLGVSEGEWAVVEAPSDGGSGGAVVITNMAVDSETDAITLDMTAGDLWEAAQDGVVWVRGGGTETQGDAVSETVFLTPIITYTHMTQDDTTVYEFMFTGPEGGPISVGALSADDYPSSDNEDPNPDIVTGNGPVTE